MGVFMERTLVLVKPDGVARGLIGEVIKRFELSGLKIVGMKMVRATEDLASRHYPSSDEWFRKAGQRSIETFKAQSIDINKRFGTTDPISIGRIIKSWLVKFITSGEVVAMVLEGNRAIDNVRRLIGETDPLKALPGTIRGDFSIDNVILGNSLSRPMVNVVHASGDKKEAENEIGTWFEKSELYDYNTGADDVFYKEW